MNQQYMRVWPTSAELTGDAEDDDSAADDEKITRLHVVERFFCWFSGAPRRDSVDVQSFYGFFEDFHHFL